MKISDLIQKHHNQLCKPAGAQYSALAKEHAEISVVFTISILSELQTEIGSLSPAAHQIIKNKIKELL